ncbi:MAG: hypothetical protein HY471_03290 [Candidatus Sungbacteria bacterium]|nr:hypothetical protein [Candidatus Sungbacteria bacterium]
MPLRRAVFKDYDIRGIYPTEISYQDAAKVGNAFVRFLIHRYRIGSPNVFIGRDIRASSDILRQSLIEGIIAAGGNCFDTGIATSPQLAYSTLTQQAAHGGIMITASHNSAEYNGFKFALPGIGWIGMQNGMREIMKYALQKKILAKRNLGKVALIQGEPDRYIRRLHQIVPRILPLRAAIDAAAGVASLMLPRVLAQYPLVYKPLFFAPDPSFRVHSPNPLSPEVDALMIEEAENGTYHISAAFDDDVDRVAFFDEHGARIRADIIFAILVREMLEEHKAKDFVFELTHSRFLAPFVESYGGRLYTSRVGRTHVPHEMIQRKAALAGETSTHLYHREIFNTDCALLTMLKVFRAVSRLAKPLSQVVKNISNSSFTQVTMNVQNPRIVVEKVEKKYASHVISTLDGISVQFPTYWFNMRMSNTERLIRLTVDADSPSELKARIQEIKYLIGANSAQQS